MSLTAVSAGVYRGLSGKGGLGGTAAYAWGRTEVHMKMVGQRTSREEVDRFRPANLTIKAGETVTWINDDEHPHTVTSGPWGRPDGRFDTGIMQPGERFKFTFAEPGVYPYYCAIHPGMEGTITVK